MPFDSVNSSVPCVKCKSNKCLEKKEENDTLSNKVSMAIEHHLSLDEDTKCTKKAREIQTERKLKLFNDFREAIPYAHAAAAVNELGDSNVRPTPKNCITMLPLNGKELSKELGLNPEDIRDTDLRNDGNGFRAVMFRNETTGKIILAARDTQPDSLVDWQTNTDNGQGRDTEQYQAMRRLTTLLTKLHNVQFDITGYSKGGGLAQEAGLINPNATIRVFNSAGLPPSSLARLEYDSFKPLESKTKSFSSEGDFLTFMNNTKDDKSQIENAKFLRQQLAGEGDKTLLFFRPLEIEVLNPEMRMKKDQYSKAMMIQSLSSSRGIYFKSDKLKKLEEAVMQDEKTFKVARDKYLAEMDEMIKQAETDVENEEQRALEEDREPRNVLTLFPKVRSGEHHTIPDSKHLTVTNSSVKSDKPNTGKLRQHLMTNIVDGMEKSLKKYKKDLSKFIDSCG